MRPLVCPTSWRSTWRTSSPGGSQARDELFIAWTEEAAGHSVGSQIWGDHNGNINFTQLDELFDLFPKASSQIEHLMLSACYSGGEAKMDQYHDMFPGLSSIWAYHDSSPGTWTGAMDHMEGWERATRSGKDPGGVDPSLARGHRKAESDLERGGRLPGRQAVAFATSSAR